MEVIYGLVGLFFFYTASIAARGRGLNGALRASFWGLYGASFLLGSHLSDFANGVIIVVMIGFTLFMREGKSTDALVASAGQVTTVRAGRVLEQPLRLLVPLLVVPAVSMLTVLLTPWLRWDGQPVLDPVRSSQMGYVFGAVAGFLWACILIRPSAKNAFSFGGALTNRVGWALILPHILAMLGGVYMAAGLTHQLGGLIASVLPAGNKVVAVAGYAVGMMLVSALVGNAFAAFPIIFGALGLPILVQNMGLPVAPVAALGMLCGFSGTLISPMAVNFNVLPISLLALKDRYAVIRTQAPVSLVVLMGNALLLYMLTFIYR